jgi:ribosomal-protein-alanine N-acetyltransferase
MTFRMTRLTEDYCQQICEWRYPAPFNIYNWPAWEQMMTHEMQFADQAIRESQFAAVIRSNDELIGYAQFFPIVHVTRLGLGLRPDLCSQGLGVHFVQSVIHEAIRRTPHCEIDLEVHTWNVRAQKTYEKVGFIVADEYELTTVNGVERFYCMVYPKIGKKSDLF